MNNTTDTYNNGRPAHLSGAEARAAADAARGIAPRALAPAGRTTGGYAAADGRRSRTRSSRQDDRGTQRANRRRDARVAPDRASESRPAAPRREAASTPTIDVNGALSAIGGFVMNFRVVLLVIALFIGLILTMYGPAKTYYCAWRKGQDLQAQLDATNASNDQLKADIQNYMTPEGIKDLARSRGYVSEGETKVVVEGLDEGADGSASSTDGADQQAEQPWYIELGDKVFHYIGN